MNFTPNRSISLSLELRWFARGASPAAVMHWFYKELDGGDGLCTAESRIDDYIAIPGCDHVGLKFRSGADLEIKIRQGAPQVAAVTAAVGGQSERWIKLAVRPQDAGDEYGTLPQRSVRKSRLVRKVDCSRSSSEAVQPKLAIVCGATVELTALETEGIHWWTFGLEAFDTRPAGRRDLTGTFNASLRHVFRAYSGPPLSAEQSFGYPRWLAEIRQT